MSIVYDDDKQILEKRRTTPCSRETLREQAIGTYDRRIDD